MNFHTKPNRYVSHVNMKVQDMERSLKFYQDVIGFQILKQEGNNIIINTTGYGHGVGMSQYGALGMAIEGYTYDEILEYYYLGTTIKKMEI